MFSILEVYTYLNSVLRVFCFHFFVFVFLFHFVSPKGQAWVFDFRNQYLVRFLSQNYHLNFKSATAKTTLRTFPSESRCRDPPQELGDTDILMDSLPMLDPPHTRLPHIKQKKKIVRIHVAIQLHAQMQYFLPNYNSVQTLGSIHKKEVCY